MAPAFTPIAPLLICLAYLAPWQLQLLRWLGAHAADAPSDARAELVWTNFPTSWGLFVFLGTMAVAFYAIVLVYRRELSCCPVWMKTILAILRCGTMLLIAAIFLGPEIAYVDTRTIQPTIALGRDASPSMSTADAYVDRTAARSLATTLQTSIAEIDATRPTRVQVLNELLAGNESAFLTALRRKGRLQLFDFADQSHDVELADTSQSHLPPLAVMTGGTNLTKAIERGLNAERPAAIILFTDGQHTTKDDCLEVARRARQRGVPLFPIGVGDPSRPSSERVVKVFARPQAWQGEPFEIEAIVSFQGAESGERRVELWEEQLSDNDQSKSDGKLVATVQVSVPANGTGKTTVRLSRTAAEPGRYVYRARLETSPRNETEVHNPATSAVVKVLSRQSIRVLLVAGSPTWDYRLVQTLLARDKTIGLSCWLQSLDEGRRQDGTQSIAHLPRTKSELFEYDIILLFDPNPAELDGSWIELIREFVGDHAGGLLFLAGPKFSGEFFSSGGTSALAKLMPVKFGDLAALDVNSLLSANQDPWPLHVPPASADHPVMRFYPDRDETLRRWQSLPGVLWSFPASEAAPAAQTLAENSDPAMSSSRGLQPLIVAGKYGSGNTLYLGFSGTWRWRNSGRDAEFFDKFWIQAIRFLVESRSLEGRRRGYIQTDRQHYEVGQRVNLSAWLLDSAFEPLTLPKVDATNEQPEGAPEIVSLLPVTGQPGRYEGAVTAVKTGIHTVRVQFPDELVANKGIESTFEVELPNLETTQVWLNRPLLMELARQSGGRYFELDQLDQLVAAVPNRVEQVQERSPSQPLWDSPGMLAALVGLLSIEWLLRKRFSLL